MSRVETVIRLVEYDRNVFDRFERSVRRKGWAAATANRGIGHLSLKNTLVHILNVREAWLVAVAQGKWGIYRQRGRRPNGIHSWREFDRYRKKVRKDVDELSAGLTERKLARRVRAPWMPGTYTLEDAFYQVSYEQAHHLGEIIGAYWQVGWRPPKMTWIENLPSRARAAPTGPRRPGPPGRSPRARGRGRGPRSEGIPSHRPSARSPADAAE
jgi:uncharacterized damage-inducible protein DinB